MLLALGPCFAGISCAESTCLGMLGLACLALNNLCSMGVINRIVWGLRRFHLLKLESRVRNETLNRVTQTNGIGSFCSSAFDWLGGCFSLYLEFQNSFQFKCGASLDRTHRYGPADRKSIVLGSFDS
jgi:hypothetical protein